MSKHAKITSHEINGSQCLIFEPESDCFVIEIKTESGVLVSEKIRRTLFNELFLRSYTLEE